MVGECDAGCDVVRSGFGKDRLIGGEEVSWREERMQTENLAGRKITSASWGYSHLYFFF